MMTWKSFVPWWLAFGVLAFLGVTVNPFAEFIRHWGWLSGWGALILLVLSLLLRRSTFRLQEETIGLQKQTIQRQNDALTGALLERTEMLAELAITKRAFEMAQRMLAERGTNISIEQVEVNKPDKEMS